jgi:hypothetical protein
LPEAPAAPLATTVVELFAPLRGLNLDFQRRAMIRASLKA